MHTHIADDAAQLPRIDGHQQLQREERLPPPRTLTLEGRPSQKGGTLLRVMGQALTAFIQREGQGPEQGVRLLDCLAAVVDDAPAPARLAWNREGDGSHGRARSNSHAAKHRM